MIKRFFAITLIVVLFALSCRKPDQYPNVPELTFKSLTFSKDTFGGEIFTLTATFTDGDGDVGYNQGDFNDPKSPYNSNFVIKIQRFKNGIWTDTLRYHFLGANPNASDYWKDTIYPISCRIPYLTPEGQNKGLKGDIEKTDYLPLGLNDTIRFTAFLYDRALHKSNTIIIPEDGGYFKQIP